MIQLDPTFNVITPLGKGLAVVMESDDQDVYWYVFQQDTGEPWVWKNRYIRFAPTITTEHVTRSPIKVPANIKDALKHARRGPEDDIDFAQIAKVHP